MKRRPINRHFHPRPRYQPDPTPDYRQTVVLVNGNVGMAAREAALQLGRAKGGRRVQALGTGHRWTSETARAASRRYWDRLRPMNKRIGVRLGRAPKKAPRVDRVGLRAFYATTTVEGIRFEPIAQMWWVYWGKPDGYRIAERTALRRLGHLRYPASRGVVPTSVRPVPRPKKRMK